MPPPIRGGVITSCARGSTICPDPVRRTLRPSSSPYVPYACVTLRALLQVAEGAMNIHDVRDRQTSDSIIALCPRLLGAGA